MVQKTWVCSCCFSQDNGLLYQDHLKQDPDRHNDKPHQLYIAITLIHRILQEAHDAAVGGHFGAAKTYMAMRLHFFWPEM